MAIFYWLPHTKIMLTFYSIEEFTNWLDSMNEDRNSLIGMVFIEKYTNQWR